MTINHDYHSQNEPLKPSPHGLPQQLFSRADHQERLRWLCFDLTFQAGGKRRTSGGEFLILFLWKSPISPPCIL